METRSKANVPSAAGLGPYKATKLWNDVISAFRQGVPVGKHRRYMRTAENCFVGSSGVDWLLQYLKRQRDFGSDVTRLQATSLLNKFYKAGIFEEIQISHRGRNKQDFSDSNRLYRLLPMSPSKGTRTPLSARSTNSAPVPDRSLKDGKGEKDKHKTSSSGKEGGKEKKKDGRVEEKINVNRLPQCHLVGRFLTGSEIHEIWKTAALSRLKKVLGVGNLDDVLQGFAVDGNCVRHNCIFLNKSGIVTNIQPEDQLPHWVLSAMKCLARLIPPKGEIYIGDVSLRLLSKLSMCAGPERMEGDLPSYPGFEKDVFGVVRDYFLGLQEPLITYELYDVVINVFVQACHQLPRHSSPFSHATGSQNGLGQSLWSESSLENVIQNLTRKYCLADSKTDLYSLTSSRPELCHTTAEGFSDCYSRSEDVHSLFASSHGNLAGSRGTLTRPSSQGNLTNGRQGSSLAGSHGTLTRPSSQGNLTNGRQGSSLAGSYGNLTASRGASLAESYGSLAVNSRGTSLADGPVDMARANSQGYLASSQGDLAVNPKDSSSRGGRSLTAAPGCRRRLLRMARSQGDLQHHQRSSGRSHNSSLPSHSQSQVHLPAGGQGSDADACADLHQGTYVTLHEGRSLTNLHATSQRLAHSMSVTAGSHSAMGRLSGPSSLKDSKQFSSSPDLPVTRFETAFGPDNLTVTRVFYSNGVATDFHHGSAQAEDEIPPTETHFDFAAETSRHPSAHISFEQRNNRSANATGCSDTSRHAEQQRSRSFNQFQRQQQEAVGVRSSPPPYYPTSERGEDVEPLAEHDNPAASPAWARGRRPPPYRRRTRAERYNTFAGTQLTAGQEKVAESRGLDHWDKELSASTPYLPGLKLGGGEGTEPGHPRRFISKSTGAAGPRVRKCASTYVSFPQSSLHEDRAVKALQMVCLLIPPASRRKLHFLLKLISKMAANPFLTFDPSQTTRSLVLGTFQQAVLRSRGETELDAVLVFQLVSFLVDHHMDVLAPPRDMKEAVEDRLRALERPQITYSPRDPGTLRFSQPISVQQYEASKVDHSHQALVDLLDSIVRDQNMADREKRRRLKQFQKTYPQLYKRRFPTSTVDPLQAERRLKTKPPIFPKPLSRMRSLRV